MEFPGKSRGIFIFSLAFRAVFVIFVISCGRWVLVGFWCVFLFFARVDGRFTWVYVFFENIGVFKRFWWVLVGSCEFWCFFVGFRGYFVYARVFEWVLMVLVIFVVFYHGFLRVFCGMSVAPPLAPPLDRRSYVRSIIG